MISVLYIDDEPINHQLVGHALQPLGCSISYALNGISGIAQARTLKPDILITDVMMPDINGYEVTRQLRRDPQFAGVPILVLTARGRWEERVEGLEAGADDYLAKPFQMEELSARIKALIRRVVGAPQSLLTCGNLVLNLETQQAMVNSLPIELTAFEYRMLEYLAQRYGKIVSKDELRIYLYPHDNDPESNVLTVLLGRLRRKLDPNGIRNPIETVRSRGYRLL